MNTNQYLQQILKNHYKNNPKLFNAKEGGVLNIPFEKQATNFFVSGLPKSMEYMANAEVEDGEYLISLSNEVQKVLGNTHEKGGEKMLLDPGTKVVSDHKTLGDQAKICGEKYNVKLNSSDTFAEAIEKYSKTIGLTEKMEELENLYKQVKAQDDIFDAETKKINLEFLATEIKEEKEEMAELLKQREAFTSYIFNKQEKSKQEDMKQSKDDDIKKFKDGGMLSALCKKHGISEEEGMKILMENDVPQYKDGNVVEPYAYGTDKLHKSDWNQEEWTKALVDLGINPNQSNIAIQKELYSRYKDPIDATHAKFGMPVGGREDGLLGERWVLAAKAALEAKNTPAAAPEKVADKVVEKETVDATKGITDLNLKTKAKAPAHLILPAQMNLPPDALVAQLALNPKRERLSPIEMSPEANLVEINKAQNFANMSANMQPFAQNAGLLSNISANTAEQINKAIVSTNQTNVQNEYSTNLTNLQQSNMEKGLQDNAKLDYEKRSQTAMALTLQDYYNWFSANQANSVAQFNFLNKYQTAQGLFENVTTDEFGVPIFDKTQGRKLSYPAAPVTS